jgi:hypothetical protein
MAKKILITGATGFIGRPLCHELVNNGYQVVVVSRRPAEAEKLFEGKVTAIGWDAFSGDRPAEPVEGTAAIINLAGDNIASGRWTEKKKNLILQSRLDAGKAVTKAIKNAAKKPRVLIQASGIGYYGDRGDEPLYENSSNGNGFLADVAEKWEGSVRDVEAMGVSTATVRLGVVLGRNGGVVSRLVTPFRFFIGGHPGSGKQWLSWIHIEDVIGVIRMLIEDNRCKGTFNLTAPEPILSKKFYGIFGKTMYRPSIFPMPAFMLRVMLGEIADELLLTSNRVIPQRLLETGYKFRFPNLSEALGNILK